MVAQGIMEVRRFDREASLNKPVPTIEDPASSHVSEHKKVLWGLL